MKVTRAKCLGIGMVFVLGGCIGVIAGLILAHKDYRLIHDGVASNAIVTALSSKRYSKGTEYSVYYHYQDAARGYHTANSVIWFPEWRQLQVNGLVPILFVRENPTENRVNLPYETKLYHDNGTLLPLFAAFMTFVGIGLMVATYFDANFPISRHPTPIPNCWPFRRHVKPNRFHKTY
jgi:hypothetical protein